MLWPKEWKDFKVMIEHQDHVMDSMRYVTINCRCTIEGHWHWTSPDEIIECDGVSISREVIEALDNSVSGFIKSKY